MVGSLRDGIAAFDIRCILMIVSQPQVRRMVENSKKQRLENAFESIFVESNGTNNDVVLQSSRFVFSLMDFSQSMR